MPTLTPLPPGRLPLDRRRGSLPIALTVSFLVLTLTTSLFLTVLLSQRTAQFDTDFVRALHAAETGLERALESARGDLEALATDPIGEVRVGSGENSSDGFEWELTKVAPEAWEAVATGQAGEVSRTVTATVSRDNLFNTAAFSNRQLRLQGANLITSYNSDTGEVDTGRGPVGSNTEMQLVGNAGSDEIYLYDGAECVGNNCDDAVVYGYSEPKQLDTSFILADMQTQCGGTSGFSPLTLGDGASIPGGVQCVSNLAVPDSGAEISVEAGEEAIIYVTDTIDIDNHVRLNCPAGECDEGPQDGGPDPVRLQVYSVGQQVSIGNNTELAWLLYAPKAACSGANAQADIYGSIICNDLTGVGGFRAHWDEATADNTDIRTSSFVTSDWREELGVGAAG